MPAIQVNVWYFERKRKKTKKNKNNYDWNCLVHLFYCASFAQHSVWNVQLWCDLVYSPSLVFLPMVFQLHAAPYCVLFLPKKFVCCFFFFFSLLYGHELSRFINSIHKRSNEKSAQNENMAIICWLLLFDVCFCWCCCCSTNFFFSCLKNKFCLLFVLLFPEQKWHLLNL